MKVVFLCYLTEYYPADDFQTYGWDEWWPLEDYNPMNDPSTRLEPGIERKEDGSIHGFDIIAEISDDWKDGIPEGREDEYSDESQEALWEGVKAVFPPNGAGVKITQETLEDYATRFLQIYEDAKKEAEE